MKHFLVLRFLYRPPFFPNVSAMYQFAGDDVQVMLIANKSDICKKRKIATEKGQKVILVWVIKGELSSRIAIF